MVMSWAGMHLGFLRGLLSALPLSKGVPLLETGSSLLRAASKPVASCRKRVISVNRFYSPVRTAGPIELLAEADLPTEFGSFRIVGFRDGGTGEEFVAIVKGVLDERMPTLVRIHSQCLTGEVFGSNRCDCRAQLRVAMQLIEREGRGVIVYQQQEGRGIGIINKIRAYALQDDGMDTVEANIALGFEADLRHYHGCVAIIKQLGLRRVKVMSNNPRKIAALRLEGVEVVERIPIEIGPHERSRSYLRTKKEKLGHMLA